MADHENRKMGLDVPTSLFSQMQHPTHFGINQVYKLRRSRNIVMKGMWYATLASFFHDLPSLHLSSFPKNDSSTCILSTTVLH